LSYRASMPLLTEDKNLLRSVRCACTATESICKKRPEEKQYRSVNQYHSKKEMFRNPLNSSLFLRHINTHYLLRNLQKKI
jgi:hypothetical protein